MNKIISWYNQNRKKIWTVIIAVIVIMLILWQLMDIVTKNSQKSNYNQSSNFDENTFNSISISSDKSVISGTNITTSKDAISVLDEFISYCNGQKVEEAYNLISDECKEEMYPELKDFQESYYNQVFAGQKKNVTTENWIGNIYKVDFKDDFLSTGKYTTENTLQDYITIVSDDNNEYKLNINKYVGRYAINKEVNSEDVNIKVVQRDTYMDYEIYTFEVTNNSDLSIILGDTQNLDASYLVDKNDLQYNAYVHELAQPQLMITSKQTKKIKIKYFNQYSSTRQIKKLVFPKVILDYDAYQLFPDKNYYKDYAKVEIDI